MALPDDYQAACDVVRRYMPAALRSAFDPQDFVHDAIVIVWAKAGRIDRSRPLRNLLIRIARCLILTELRRAKLRLPTPLEADPRPGPLEVAIGAEIQANLLAYGRRPHLREAIRLRLEGWEVHEIEPMVGWNRGAGFMYFKRLKENLRWPA